MKSFDEAIADLCIDERHAVSLLRRRNLHRLRADRPKFFAGDPPPSIWLINKNQPDYDAACLGIKSQNIAEYAHAWAALNHLKG